MTFGVCEHILICLCEHVLAVRSAAENTIDHWAFSTFASHVGNLYNNATNRLRTRPYQAIRRNSFIVRKMAMIVFFVFRSMDRTIYKFSRIHKSVQIKVSPARTRVGLKVVIHAALSSDSLKLWDISRRVSISLRWDYINCICLVSHSISFRCLSWSPCHWYLSREMMQARETERNAPLISGRLMTTDHERTEAKHWTWWFKRVHSIINTHSNHWMIFQILVQRKRRTSTTIINRWPIPTILAM